MRAIYCREKLASLMQKQSYLQPPVLNAMYDAEKKMQEIMEARKITASEKKQVVFGSTESVFLLLRIRWRIITTLLRPPHPLNLCHQPPMSVRR